MRTTLLILTLIIFYVSLSAQGKFVRVDSISVPPSQKSEWGNFIAGVDLDKDGLPEIYAVNTNVGDTNEELRPKLYKYEYKNGKWTLVWSTLLELSAQNTWPALTTGDLDKDGKEEIIWGPSNYLNYPSSGQNTNPMRIAVYESRGDGSDKMGVDFFGDYYPNAHWSITSQDNQNIRPIQWFVSNVDFDNKNELVYCDYSGTAGQTTSFGVISVDNIPDNADGSEKWTMETSGKDGSLAPFMSNNPKYDIVYLDQMQTLYLFESNGYVCPIKYDLNTWKAMPVQKNLVSGSWKSAQVVDIDKDGKKEIIVGGWTDGKVYLCKQHSDSLDSYVIGDFSKLGVTRLNGGASGDIDGDGLIDFVFGSRADKSNPVNAVCRLQYKGGPITDPNSYSATIIDSLINSSTGQLDAIRIADVDYDGKQEVCYTSGYCRGPLDYPRIPIVILRYVPQTPLPPTWEAAITVSENTGNTGNTGATVTNSKVTENRLKENTITDNGITDNGITDNTLTGNSLNNSDRLIFGQAPQATDGRDPLLGEYDLPPLPPSGGFDLRFRLPVASTEFAKKDYRCDTLKKITWTMQFQPGAGGYPLTVSWDPSSLYKDGTFYLKDAVDGSIINVNMKLQSSYVLTNTNINILKIEYKNEITRDVPLSTGWNIVSVPVLTPDMSTQTLFPNATAPVYLFNNGYLTTDQLSNAIGYWLRYANSASVPITGAQIHSATIPVKAGWNLIGPYDKNAPVSTISTTPSGILSSYFFGYRGGYSIADTLRPGTGYWVKSAQDGVLNIEVEVEAEVEAEVKVEVESNPDKIGTTKSGVESNPDKIGTMRSGVESNPGKIGTMKSGVEVERKKRLENHKNNNWGKLIVEDNDGNRGMLYIIDNMDSDISEYDLPPVPPAGIFDVRYASDRMAEKASADFKINSAVYPLIITAEGIDLKIKDAINGSMINTIIKNGHSVTISNKELDKFTIESLSSSVPLNYELYQNYPNPFNPSTKIRYTLAKDSHVALKIYNALGETVAQLIDAIQPSGPSEVTFNAMNLSSGIYFYELHASSTDGSKTFREVKKLLLLK